jgi:hypothetical protein
MLNQKGLSLRGLMGKMMLSFSFSLLGSWGLLITRLKLQPLEVWVEPLMAKQFQIDLAGGSLFLLGIFLTVYYRLRLGPLLKRLEALGLHQVRP